MHQLFELLTLIETGKFRKIPILLYNQQFWGPMIDIIHDLYSKFGTISKSDKELLEVIEKPDQVLEHLH